jgi:hypothetical protein
MKLTTVNNNQKVIRKATYNDVEWMAELSFEKFNEVYKNYSQEVSKETLEDIYKEMTESYCFDDKSGFICAKLIDGFLYINAWYGGMKLWKYLESLGIGMIGFMHKCEKKFKRFLERKGYEFLDFNDELYFVRGNICHQ